MTLRAWQDTLAELIISGGSATHAGQRSSLSQAERTWLAALPRTPGFEMMCAVQRWWRKLAIAESAPLVLALLTCHDRRDLVTRYFAEKFEASLFPLMEALHFLEFVLDRGPIIPHLEAVATFELGLLRLTQAASQNFSPEGTRPAPDESSAIGFPECGPVRHPLACMVRFSSPPHEVLGAIMAGRRPPSHHDEHWLLLAPRLPNLSRLATADEARVFETMELNTARDARAFAALWKAGALILPDAA